MKKGWLVRVAHGFTELEAQLCDETHRGWELFQIIPQAGHLYVVVLSKAGRRSGYQMSWKSKFQRDAEDTLKRYRCNDIPLKEAASELAFLVEEIRSEAMCIAVGCTAKDEGCANCPADTEEARADG